MMEGFAFQADKALLDTVFDGVVVIELKHLRISLANKAAASILGFDDPEELVGGDPFRHIPQEDRERMTTALAGLVSGSCLRAGAEIRVLDKRGRDVWVTARGVKLASNGNSVLLASFRDITAQKTAELALREAEKSQIDLLNSTNELILISQEWKIVFTNRRLQEATGLSEGAMVGMSILDLTHPDDRKAVARRYRQMLDGKYLSTDRAFKGIGKDGKTSWGMMRHVPFTWQGKPALMTIIQDITQQMVAEEALKKSEEKYRALAEQSIQGIVIAQGMPPHFVYCNKTMADMVGCTVDEMVSMTPEQLAQLIHPNDRETFFRRFADRLKGLPLESLYSFRGLRRDGAVRWLEVFSTPVEYQGAPALQAAFVDITERRHAEEALQRQERLFRLLTENSSDLVVLTNPDGTIMYESPAVKRVLGFTPEERVGASLFEHLHPEDAVIVTDSLRRLKETAGAPVERHEVRLRHKDGSWRTIESAACVVARGSAVEGIIINLRDITERKRAEEALLRIGKAIESSSDAIGMSDAQGHHFYHNKAFADLFEYTAEELEAAGGGPAAYADQNTAREVFRIIRSGGSWSGEVEMVSKSGRRLPVLLRADAVKDESGRVVGLVGVHSDITELKRAQEALTASEANYRRLFDHTLIGLEVVDAETMKVVLANRSVASMFGFGSPEDMVGTEPLDYVVPEDVDLAVGYLAKALADTTFHDVVTLRVRTEDGRIIWVTGMATPFEYVCRRSILLSLEDVTAAKDVELKMAESEEKNRLLVDNAAEGIIVVQEGLLKFANPKCTEISGYTAAELLSRPFLQLVHPNDRQMIADNYVKRLAGEEAPNNYWFRIVDKAGGTKWLQINTVQFSWEGRPAVLSMLNDVTERRQAEEALQQSEQRFRALIEGARDAIAVIDPKGKVTYSSPSAERMANGYLETLITMSLQERIHRDDLDRVTSIFESLLRSPDGTVVDTELRYRRDDESWGVIEARGTNWVHDPKIGGIVVNYRDITERKQTEEAFWESESRYRLLVENVSDVIWSVNMRSKRVLFSPSVTRLLGYTLQEAQAMKMKEVVSPTSYPKAMMAFSELLGKQGNGSQGRSLSTQVEIELMRKDGSFVWVDISVTLLRDEKGQPAEVFGVIRDITQRRKVEEDLRTSEEYFRALIENAWDAIAIVNAEGTMLYESPSSARILGYEPEEIVGKNLAEFVRPEDITAIADTFRRFRTEPGSIVMVDAGFRHKDGHYVECEGTLQNFLHDPKISGVVANYRDVTDRRRAEEAIRSSEERFRNLVEATSDWVWEVDPNGIYTYASPNMREVMGYEVGEVIGKDITDFMPAREASRFGKVFKSHAANKEPFAFVENSRIHKDGRIIVMETSGVPFLGDDGRLLGYRGVGRDITSRKKTEKDLENSLKKVEKTMEAAIQAISYTMETRDPYTTGHQRRVTQLACAIAKEMGVAPWQIDGIRVAGLLHDIGKIAVPTEILSKPGRLSDIEFSMIKAHPKVGFDILKNVEFEWPIARIVVQHHERLNGSGYPFGLQGKDIMQESRILAVADVVEAMSSHRPYRPALGIDKALAEVARGEGTLYDSEVVHACAKVIKERGFSFQG